MKSYFCKNCGRDYKLAESLRNGQSLYCFKCPSTQLSIAGVPLILVGAAIFVLFVVHRVMFPGASGAEITFLPAAFGIALVGVLRITQARRQRKLQKLQPEAEAKETTVGKTAAVNPKQQRSGDTEKWDSPASTPATPDKVEI